MEVIKIPEHIKLLAEELSFDFINEANQKKLYEETILSKTVEYYLFSHSKKYSFEIRNNLPDDKESTSIYRKELLPLNYINFNGIFIDILNLDDINQEKLFIDRRILKSNLSPDIYLVVFWNKEEENITLIGHINYDILIEKIVFYNQYHYNYNISNLNKMETFFEFLIKPDTWSNTIYSLANYVKSYVVENKPENRNFNLPDKTDLKKLNEWDKKLKEKTIPDDFIDEVFYLPEDIYYHLLYSEKESEKYLYMINKFENIRKDNLLYLNTKKIKSDKLASIFLHNNKIKDNKFPHLKLAAVDFSDKAMLFEFDMTNNIVNKTNIIPEVIFYEEENNITIRGLEKYSGKNWLVFIDIGVEALKNMNISEKDYGDIFINWNNEDFIAKNQDIIERYAYKKGSISETDVIDKDGYIDLKIENVISSDMNILIAVVI